MNNNFEPYREKQTVEGLPIFEDKLEVHTPEKVENDYSKVFHSTLKEIEAKEPEWIIEGCIQKGNAINLLVAFENTGKTFVSLEWCLYYVTGATSWHGKKITSVSTDRKVVYLFSEGNESSLKVRMTGWLNRHNEKLEDIDDKFILLDLKEFGRITNGDIKLSKKNIEILVKGLHSKGINQVDLFVIDTLNGFEEGNENDNTDCANFLNNLIYLNNIFDGNSLVIHHAGTSSLNLPIEEIRPRGASALSGRVDNTTIVKGSILKGLEFFNRKCRDAEKGRFFVRGVKITVDNAIPNCFGEYPTTVVIDDTPSDEIEREIAREEKASLQATAFLNNKKISSSVRDFFSTIVEGMKSEKLPFEKGEKDGEYSFYRKDLKQYLINDCGYSKNKASMTILFSDDRALGKLISLGMLSTNKDNKNVRTKEIKCFTHNNSLYSSSIGKWEFETDSEIEKRTVSNNNEIFQE